MYGTEVVGVVVEGVVDEVVGGVVGEAIIDNPDFFSASRCLRIRHILCRA